MNEPLKILILEDSTTDAELVQRLLKKEKIHCEFNIAMNKESFLKALEKFSPDVILSDNSLPQFSATEALKIVRDQLLYVPFILVTGTVSDEFAANIIKSGADDYVLKDRLTRLPAAIDAALKQRKAEKEIADYKYALDHSAIISITDQKGIIKYSNDNFCRISKYPAEELIGQDHRIINSGYHPKSYIKNLWTTIANGNIWRGEFRNRAKDGSIYWVDATIIPFLNKKGKPYQYLAIRVDITEKKKAEEKIQKSEEQYKDLVENITDLICTHDLEGRVLSVNRAAEELMGHKFNQQENLNIKDILTPDKKNEFNRYINDLKKRGHVQGLMKVKTFTGKIHIWEYNNSLKTTGVSTPIVRGYARDITESKKAEKDILQMNEQLRELSEHLQNVREEERTNMSREIHDQLGQQMTVLKMDISWLSKKLNPEDNATKEKIKELQKVLDETVNMVRKIASDLRPSLLDDLGLGAAIEWHLGEFQERSGIKTTLKKIEAEPALSDAIKTGMFRIVQESLTNVARYSQAKKVTINLQTQKSQLILTIEDDGVGFDKEKVAAKKTFGILGMKERTLIMKGTYEINSAPGKGTTIIVKVPLERKMN